MIPHQEYMIVAKGHEDGASTNGARAGYVVQINGPLSHLLDTRRSDLRQQIQFKCVSHSHPHSHLADLGLIQFFYTRYDLV